MAPYLRGRSRQLFDDLVSGKLPPREFSEFLKDPARESDGIDGDGDEDRDGDRDNSGRQPS